MSSHKGWIRLLVGFPGVFGHLHHAAEMAAMGWSITSQAVNTLTSGRSRGSLAFPCGRDSWYDILHGWINLQGTDLLPCDGFSYEGGGVLFGMRWIALQGMACYPTWVGYNKNGWILLQLVGHCLIWGSHRFQEPGIYVV